MAKEKFKKATLLILFAVSFHNSSFILFVLLLLLWLNPSRKAKIIFFFLTIMIAYAIAPVFKFALQVLSFETRYFREGVETGFASANGLFNGVVGILVSIGVNAMIKHSKTYNVPNVYRYIVYLYLLISIVTLRLPILSRYMMFFTPYIIIMVANLTYSSKKNIKYAFYVGCIMFGNIIVKQWLRPEWISIFPYEFYNDRQLSLIM